MKSILVNNWAELFVKNAQRLLLVPEPLLKGFGMKLEEQFPVILSANLHGGTAEHLSELGGGGVLGAD